MSNDYGLTVMRAQTSAYIATDPTSLVFVPREKSDDGRGGRRWVPAAPLGPQTVMVITAWQRGNGSEERTVDGEVFRPDLVLLCEWDAQIERGWQCEINGDTYEVVDVQVDLRYERVASVVRRG